MSGSGTLLVSSQVNLNSIERVELRGAALTIEVSDLLVATAGVPRLAIQSFGNDTINTLSVVAGRTVDSLIGNGADTVLGGAADDRIFVTNGEIGATDTVSGGGGTDRFILSNASVISAADLANVTGIEVVEMRVAGSTIYLSQAMAGTSSSPLLVLGSTGSDVVDASATTTGIVVSSQTGDDLHQGGTGADDFRFKAGELTSSDSLHGGQEPQLTI